MKIGILSDTHNDIMMTRRALEEFTRRSISIVLHAGDLSSPEMISVFEGFDMHIVLGNCDSDHAGIVNSCKCSGITPATRACEFEIAGKKFFLIHSDDFRRYQEALQSGKYDYIITGHTHMYMVSHKHSTMVINPGAVTRDYRSDVEQTCAVLDVETGDVEKIYLD
jgi:uncharacterized protein